MALAVTLYVLPGRQASGPLAVVGLALAVTVVGVVLRPVLAGLAVVLGSLGLLLVGIASQAIILDAAIAVSPNLDIHGVGEVILVSWSSAALAAVANWVFDAGSEEAFLAGLLGRAVRVAHRERRGGGPTAGNSRGGLLILQFDGVGEDILRQAMEAGTAPTLRSWLQSQAYTLRGWHTGLPATTPAGQAVLLHGNEEEVPAFRWWEKDSRRLTVVNHPSDAAQVEQRISNGRGLLADRGVSVSNLFSGDAPTPLVTMSNARLPPRTSRGYASFAMQGGGLVRSVVVAGGQVITELYQGRRQRRRDVIPRVRRGVVFAVQRAVTTAFLRDVSVALVTEQIARAAPVIYVDWTDYDEVAHHAGPSRRESMDALEGLDRLAQFFSDVIRETGWSYEMVIVSDHGQSQGATFAQLGGRSLDEVVEHLTTETPLSPAAPLSTAVPLATAAPVATPAPLSPSEVSPDRRVHAESQPAERWGSANLLLTGFARSQGRATGTLSRFGLGRTVGPAAEITVGRPRSTGATAASNKTDIVVAVSGSLAHIYLTRVPGRAVQERIDELYPRLTLGLARHPHIGAVMVRSSADDSLVVRGAEGWRRLTSEGAVGGDGVDPLGAFGPQAAADLRALDRRRNVGDLVVLGRFDAGTGEVAAFEELVGSHGGLGGHQTEAVLLHPAAWSVPPSTLHGLDVHDLLRSHLVPRDEPDRQ